MNNDRNKTITVLFCPVGLPPVTKTIPYTLKDEQQLVGGYIEMVKMDGKTVAIVNEEGMIKGLPKNRMFYGDFFLCGIKGSDFVSINPKELGYWKACLS